MKKLMIALSLLMLAQPMLADDVKPRRTRPRGASRPSGGIVEKAYCGNVLRIVNTQDKISFATIDSLTRQMRLAALLPFEATSGTADECAMQTAEKALKEKGVGAAVVIVDSPKLPWMLVAPEARWTILNVSPLIADQPTADKLAARMGKVLWCAVARTLGAGYSSYPGCVLTPFSTPAELDVIAVSRPCPEPFNKMIDTGAKYGINTITIASYRSACEKGWAPPPTNAVQKAIWEKVQYDKERGPSRPILISPPNKK